MDKRAAWFRVNGVVNGGSNSLWSGCSCVCRITASSAVWPNGRRRRRVPRKSPPRQASPFATNTHLDTLRCNNYAFTNSSQMTASQNKANASDCATPALPGGYRCYLQLNEAFAVWNYLSVFVQLVLSFRSNNSTLQSFSLSFTFLNDAKAAFTNNQTPQIQFGGH